MTMLGQRGTSDSTSGELKAFNVIDGTYAVMRDWKLVLATTVLGTVCGLIAAVLVAPVWESEANVQIGAVYGHRIEDPRALGSFLASDAFRRSIPSRFEATRPDALRVQAIDGGGETVAYVRIIARGRTPQDAHALAAYVLEFVTKRHAKLFTDATRDFTEYQDLVARNLKQVEAGISQLEATLNRMSSTSRDGALAALLVQSQLESKRIGQVQLAKELRDSRFDKEMNTRPTEAIGPPSEPIAPIWPRREFFSVMGAALGFILSIAVILAFRRSGPAAR